MRVLGVDPGLTRCGVGVVEGSPGRPLALVHVEVIRTPAQADTAERLHAVFLALRRALEIYQPDAVAVERVFAKANIKGIMGTAQASALPLVLAIERGIPVASYTPTEVKAAVTGNGRAEKLQVTAMVTRLLRLASAPQPADAADALALAMCHAWRAGTTHSQRLQRLTHHAPSARAAGAAAVRKACP